MGIYMGLRPKPRCAFIWGSAPCPALFFEKKRGKKLLLSMPFSANTAVDAILLIKSDVPWFLKKRGQKLLIR